jgi:predicted O-methyltransferase YrrM
MHSPFVFDFIRNVLMDKRNYPAYAVVESLRNELLQRQVEIPVADPGAGSAINNAGKRQISSIAKHAAKSRKFGQLLCRMVQYYKSSTIVELGTSLGITTSYLSLANKEARVITMEGVPAIASLAKKTFEKLHLFNVMMVEGNFDHTLLRLVDDVGTIDFAFLDGNHRMEPTVRYFNDIVRKINSHSIVVVDDIHWSRDMENAWQAIKDHHSVKCSIDLFFIGILFFRKEFHEKQHFTIRY